MACFDVLLENKHIKTSYSRQLACVSGVDLCNCAPTLVDVEENANLTHSQDS